MVCGAFRAIRFLRAEDSIEGVFHTGFAEAFSRLDLYGAIAGRKRNCAVSNHLGTQGSEFAADERRDARANVGVRRALLSGTNKGTQFGSERRADFAADTGCDLHGRRRQTYEFELERLLPSSE